jgi:hypothetical protein
MVFLISVLIFFNEINNLMVAGAGFEPTTFGL